MQLFLSLADSTKDAPNENFARELMELFTLGTRLLRARRARGGARADRLHRRLARRRHRHDPLRGRRARRRRQDAARQTRPLRRRRRARPRRAPTRDHAPFLVAQAVGASSSRRRRAARPLRALARLYRARRAADQAGRAGDPRAPGALRATSTRPTSSSARSSTSPGALRTTGTHVDARLPDVDARRRWASSRSTRRASPAGTGARRGCRSNSMRQRFALGNYVVDYGRPRVRRGSAPATLTAARGVRARAASASADPQVSAATQRRARRTSPPRFFDDLDPRWRDKADWRGEALQARCATCCSPAPTPSSAD